MEIALAGATLLTGLISGNEQKESYDTAAAQSRDMAARNAQRIEAETQEQARQVREDERRKLGMARAAAGASGAAVSSGSSMAYMDELKRVGDKEVDWIRKSGESRAAIERAGGEWAGQSAEAEGDAAWWGTMAGSVSSAGSFLF